MEETSRPPYLPMEIVDNIAKCAPDVLDTCSYLEDNMEEDPAVLFDQEGNPIASHVRRDLKNASLVCRGWKRIFGPLIFRHLLDRLPLTQAHYGATKESDPSVDFVDFLRRNKFFLTEVTMSFTLFVLPPRSGGYASRFMQLRDPRFAFDTTLPSYVENHPPHLLYDPFAEVWEAVELISPQRITVFG
jgi:hypothetical protein